LSSDINVVQKTLEGAEAPVMPKIRTSDGHILDWDREAIVRQLLRETKLSEEFYDIPPIDEEKAREVAKKAEKRIRSMGVKYLSGPLVREIVNVILLEDYHQEWRNIATRVGTPVYDAHMIDIGNGFEANENANLQDNAETSHKKKADKISKEQYLLLLPLHISDAHLNGDIHIHDLEYLGTRGFCQDWDLRYFFYYGLMPDGSGTKASVAGPAKKAEVAILHAVKALGSAQTNFAGGQGFYNFLTFLAPYFEGFSYEEIEQLMQMFVYEMTQMMVARGGQIVFSSVQLTPGVPKIWEDKPVVYKGKVWNGEQAPLRTYSEFEREVRLAFKALMNVMLKGDYWGKPFNFPKPEISIEPDFMTEDEEFNRTHPELPTYDELYDIAFKLAAKYGSPYFDNQLPEYRGAGKGISCYQCLGKDELVPLVQNDEMRVKRIGELFDDAAKNGKDIDPNGVEFVELNGSTPTANFETLEASIKEFKGVMRQRYRGKLLNIILESGRRIKVTPDHPVFVLKNGAFTKKQARELDTGDYVPVLKSANYELPAITSIDVEKTLNDAGYSEEIVVNEGEVNIKHAKKRGLPKNIPITKELVKFLGYYLAEGCSDHSGRRYTVRLSFGKHESELIEDAIRCIRSAGIEPKISEEKTAINVVVNSKLLYLLIDALGCGHNAPNKSVPDLLFNVERELVGLYLNCAFNGDGNIDVQINRRGAYDIHANGLRLKIISRDAVQKLVWLAHRIGVQMNYYERKQTVKHPQTGDAYKLTSYITRVTSQDQIKNFSKQTDYGQIAIADGGRDVGGVFTRIPLEETGLEYSDLKYPCQYRSSGHKKVNKSLIVDSSHAPIVEKLINGDLHVLPVKRIEEVDYDDYVYDLVDVSYTHNFSNALGVITGNCCAYQFSSTAEDDEDFDKKLRFQDGKHFSMGAWQVVSVNCPRAAYRAEYDDERLFSELKRLMDVAVELFKNKKKWMDIIAKNNRMPFVIQRPKDPLTGKKGDVAVYTQDLVYTIGVVGINEMVQHHIGAQLHESQEAFKLAIRAMTEMEFYARELSERHGMKIVLARTPAETTAQRFAVADLLHSDFATFAEKVIKGDVESAKERAKETRDLPIYYTNGTHVFPGANVSLVDRIDIEHAFFPIVDGGDILHIFMGESTPDPRGLKELAMNIAKNTPLHGRFSRRGWFTREMWQLRVK